MLRHYRIIILPRAAIQLAEIRAYIKGDSPQNAAAVFEAISNAIDSLRVFPFRFKVHSSRDKPEREVRGMVVYPFIVYYRVLEGIQSVEVLRVRHGARRRPRKF